MPIEPVVRSHEAPVETTDTVAAALEWGIGRIYSVAVEDYRNEETINQGGTDAN